MVSKLIYKTTGHSVNKLNLDLSGHDKTRLYEQALGVSNKYAHLDTENRATSWEKGARSQAATSLPEEDPLPVSGGHDTGAGARGD